ncbi:MAG: hypothetical protein QM674_18325 [Burkholderiaceae bacterium]
MLDTSSILTNTARTIDALFAELQPLKGQDRRFDALVGATERLVREAVNDEFLARPMTESVARVLQAADLMRHSTPEVVGAFLGTRCPSATGAWGAMFGTIGRTLDKATADRIVERANVAR